MADAMADMFEEAGIEDEEELKHYSELLGMCETIEEMKVKFESIQSLRESREDDDHVVREPLPPTQNRQLQEQQYTPQPAQPKDFITTRLISRMCG